MPTLFSKQLLPMNLQFFAEESTENQKADDTQVDVASEKEEPKEKTFNRSDIAKMLAAEKSKWEQEYETKLEQERNEAAELAKLSEKEKEKKLLDKERSKLEQEKADFRKEQLFVEKGKQLVSQGMPAEFAGRVVGETAEEILADVEKLRTEWDKAVEAKVNERLSQKPQKVGVSTGAMTKAEIMAIKDTNERQAMIAKHRELF